MKVYVNRFPVNGPWGGGNMFVKAFHDLVPKAGHEVVPPESMTVAPDVILIAGIDNDGYGISAEQAIMYKAMMETRDRDVKLVIRVNENDARKGTTNVDDYLIRLAQHVDGTVFVSNWLRDYFLERGWPGDNHVVIINGVDGSIFKPQPKLDNGKLNIVAHHWSDNYMKGFDVYDKLDEFVGQHPDKYAFTYIGRHRRSFKHTTVVGPLHGKRLGEELGKHDVYVSASRFDPGPNHILEALACELPTFVIEDGGGCVEFAGLDACYDSWPTLQRILERCDPKVIAGLPRDSRLNKFVPGGWQPCVQEYIDFLEATCRRTTSASGSTSS